MALVNCIDDEDLCTKLDISSGVAYFPVGNINKETKFRITSLDVQEIVQEVIPQLPELEELDPELLQVSYQMNKIR